MLPLKPACTHNTQYRLKYQTPGFDGDNVVIIGTDAWLNANLLNPKYSENDVEAVKKNVAEIETIRRVGA